MARVQTPRRTFSFYLLPAFSLQAFSSAVEVLKLANEVVEQDDYGWQVVSNDGQPVSSSCRVVVGADTALAFERQKSYEPNSASVVVVGGCRAFPASNIQLDAWLRECRYHRMWLLGISSGTMVLARAGLAEGRRCAVHWEHYPLFSEQFPNVTAAQTTFEQDGDLHTCSGGDAPFDMFLRLVERDHGIMVANRIREKAVAYRTRSAGERQRLPIHSRVRSNHRAVIKVINHMEATVGNPVHVKVLAATACLSRRQVERLFERELGRSPSRYYLELRLERAHLLLVSSSISVVEIAIACGFVSASHFSKVYRETYGHAPHQTRLIARRNESDAPAGTANLQL
ncbi:GlxA family transcriptional regulator [Mesorhizobium sp. M8A.F.Ca.ET.165.01.1.1]|uniref:GlxA family transcriptional regulator n=1 Tax=Mesorhizobium sp. M8A.F.Ca.ET.165.01.1.1 TaxID=2563960 RepID=UPI001093C886|nr:GlxA family transcriptional regulator [Mesorhizobium sp. M8A.F.Ca.ET.165.01.1.1]TGT35927.1 GlxA family transcriptional regulator [Mesorhizobium sp. M8A.F.Ca.ET.165.01.1.1]